MRSSSETSRSPVNTAREILQSVRPHVGAVSSRCQATLLNRNPAQGIDEAFDRADASAGGERLSAEPRAATDHAEQGAKMPSDMPWMIFLSAGQIVASTPESLARDVSPWPETK